MSLLASRLGLNRNSADKLSQTAPSSARQSSKSPRKRWRSMNFLAGGSQELFGSSSRTEHLDFNEARRRIHVVLARDEQELLYAICQIGLVGDEASLFAQHAIDLLSEHGSKHELEVFLLAQLKAKIAGYMRRTKDTSDVLRDNSFQTMLLNAYIRKCGRIYLRTSLREALHSIYPLMAQCEIDPDKLPAETKQEDLLANKARLEEACQTVLESIIAAQDATPDPLRRIAYSVRTQIEGGESEVLAAVNEAETSNVIVPARPQSEGDSSLSSVGTRAVNVSAQHGGRKMSIRRFTMERGGANKMPRRQSTAGREGREAAESPTNEVDSCQHDSHPASQANAVEKTARPLSGGVSRNRSTSVSTNSSTASAFGVPASERLSRSEKVVGTFLFLRFFVPAITSPTLTEFFDQPMDAKTRRGYVLCGKLLTALCNGVDFGRKESYMMVLNPFLRQNRKKLKSFLRDVSSEWVVRKDDDLCGASNGGWDADSPPESSNSNQPAKQGAKPLSAPRPMSYHGGGGGGFDSSMLTSGTYFSKPDNATSSSSNKGSTKDAIRRQNSGSQLPQKSDPKQSRFSLYNLARHDGDKTPSVLPALRRSASASGMGSVSSGKPPVVERPCRLVPLLTKCMPRIEREVETRLISLPQHQCANLMQQLSEVRHVIRIASDAPAAKTGFFSLLRNLSRKST